VGDISDVVAYELECPFGDSFCDIVVADDVSRWVRSDDDDLVIGEVVLELSGHHQNGAEKLLGLGIVNLGIGKYLTNKVHRSLDIQGVSRLLPLDDKGGAHNMVA